MKAVLVVALIASLAANVWQLTSDGENRVVVTKETTAIAPVVAASAPARPRGPAAAPDADGLDAARTRIADLEAELAVAKDKAAQFDAMDPADVLVFSRRALAWKLRELEKIPEKDRWPAMLHVAVALTGRPGGVDEMLATLRSETDPGALVVLKRLMGALTAQKVTPEQRAQFVDVMKTGDPASRRAAAARAVIATGTTEQRQGTEPITELIEAIRTDPAPDVAGTIAEVVGNFLPAKETVAALEEALGRMGPGPDRRNVVIAIGRGSFADDRGADLYRRFGEAATQDVRDDVSAALSRSANSVGFDPGHETAEQREARGAAAKAKFFPVYQGTSELKLRQDLVRAAMTGLNIGSFMPSSATDTAVFLRELVALEPDVAQKDRLERVAKLVESGDERRAIGFDKILYGRE